MKKLFVTLMVITTTLAFANSALAVPSDNSVRASISKANKFAQKHNVKWSIVTHRKIPKAGWGRNQVTKTNSLVKAVALTAFLESRKNRKLTKFEKSQLSKMITRSDNSAATWVIHKVGIKKLAKSAKKGGMKNFKPVLVLWGASKITNSDAAEFFLHFHSILPKKHRHWGYGLFGKVIAQQRWGIPKSLPKHAHVHFKAGWDGRGHVIQAANIVCKKEHISLSMSSDSNSQTKSIKRIQKLARIVMQPWQNHC